MVSKTREKNNFVLETGRLVCEPLTSKHSSKFYVDWMNDPVVIKFMLSGGNYTIDLLNEYHLKIELLFILLSIFFGKRVLPILACEIMMLLTLFKISNFLKSYY